MSGIKVTVCRDSEEVAKAASGIIARLIRENPGAVLGLATGSTPEPTYAELVRMHQEEGLSFAGVTTFNLDEYLGLPGDHPQSYRYFMQKKLFDHIDICPWNTHVPNGMARNIDLECQSFELKISSVGGVDLWLLGIGANGHIAFNEPGSAINSPTRVVDLSSNTIESNSRFFRDPSEVPRRALTAGIETIRSTRRVLLLATGPSKAAAVAEAVKGRYSCRCPASLLQKHPKCTFIIDQEAAAELQSTGR